MTSDDYYGSAVYDIFIEEESIVLAKLLAAWKKDSEKRYEKMVSNLNKESLKKETKEKYNMVLKNVLVNAGMNWVEDL